MAVADWRRRSAMRFLLGLLLGAALGVAVGLVLAPQPGSETRKALREQLQRSPGEGEEDEPEAEGTD
jgi:gas vesicle protein